MPGVVDSSLFQRAVGGEAVGVGAVKVNSSDQTDSPCCLWRVWDNYGDQWCSPEVVNSLDRQPWQTDRDWCPPPPVMSGEPVLQWLSGRVWSEGYAAFLDWRLRAHWTLFAGFRLSGGNFRFGKLQQEKHTVVPVLENVIFTMIAPEIVAIHYIY